MLMALGDRALDVPPHALSVVLFLSAWYVAYYRIPPPPVHRWVCFIVRKTRKTVGAMPMESRIHLALGTPYVVFWTLTLIWRYQTDGWLSQPLVLEILFLLLVVLLNLRVFQLRPLHELREIVRIYKELSFVKP